jgi:DNA polymerase (family 10)
LDKHQVARTLEEIAILLELKGENSFKIRAHENAARAVDGLGEDLGLLVKEGRLTEVPGIGDSIAKKIAELWTTGRMKHYDDLAAEVPRGYLEMIRVPGLGAKKIRALATFQLGIDARAAEGGVRVGRGAGPEGLREQSGERSSRDRARRVGCRTLSRGRGPPHGGGAAHVSSRTSAVKAAGWVAACRWMETVKDVDLLVATTKPAAVAKAFLEILPEHTITGPATRTSVRLPKRARDRLEARSRRSSSPSRSTTSRGASRTTSGCGGARSIAGGA